MNTKEHPFPARLKHRSLLNKKGSHKRTYHIELDIKGSELDFSVGDSVGVFPENDPQIIDRVLKCFQASGGEKIRDKKSGEVISLLEFLSKRANLVKVTRKLLTYLIEKEISSEKKSLLLPENKALMTEYMNSFEVWDLLETHMNPKVDIEEFCYLLLPQIPRFYSIASSPLLYPEEIHLTVAELCYQQGGKTRYGVASHFLCQTADQHLDIPIYILPSHGFSLPLNDDAPLIMIGPGTGVAPFRAFLQDREARKAKGKNWLFFGERHREFDFYYQDYFLDLQKRGFLQLETAFSRDQEEKIYVQHILSQKGAEVFEWIEQGAHIYVCGDAKQMAKDVDLTLRQIIRNYGKTTEEEASAYLKTLKQEKRYLLDVY